jgi:hypothetical protein
VKQAGRDAGTVSDGGLTTEEHRELAQLRRENRRLREDVEILKRATARSTSASVTPCRTMSGRDAVRAQTTRAGQVDPAKATSLEWWAEIAEMGEEEFLGEQNRRAMRQPNEPHRYDFYFNAPWRQGNADPSTSDMIEAPWR